MYGGSEVSHIHLAFQDLVQIKIEKTIKNVEFYVLYHSWTGILHLKVFFAIFKQTEQNFIPNSCFLKEISNFFTVNLS